MKNRWIILILLLTILLVSACKKNEPNPPAEATTSPSSFSSAATEDSEPVGGETGLSESGGFTLSPQEVLARMNDAMDVTDGNFHIHFTSELRAEVNVTNDDVTMEMTLPSSVSYDFYQAGGKAHYVETSITSMQGTATQRGESWPISKKETENREEQYYILEDDGSISVALQSGTDKWEYKERYAPHGSNVRISESGKAAANAKMYLEDGVYTIIVGLQDMIDDGSFDGLTKTYMRPDAGSSTAAKNNTKTPDVKLTILIDANTYRLISVTMPDAVFYTTDLTSYSEQATGSERTTVQFALSYDQWDSVAESDATNDALIAAAKDGKPYEQSQETILAPLPDTWQAGAFILDGAEYRFPLTFDELEANGWKADFYYYGGSTNKLYQRSYILAKAVVFGHEKYDGYQRHNSNYDFILECWLMNRANHSEILKNTEIYGITFDFNARDLRNSSVQVELTLPGGITAQSTQDDVIAAYGEPDAIGDFYDRLNEPYHGNIYGDYNSGKAIVFGYYTDGTIRNITYLCLPDEGLMKTQDFDRSR